MFIALNTIIPIMSRCNKSSLCYNTFHALPLIPNTLLMDQLILDNNALFCKALIWCSLPDTHTPIVRNSDIDTKDIYIYIMMNNYGYFQRI